MAVDHEKSAVEQGLVVLIGQHLDRSIAGLGYPVGMGIGVGAELAEAAAQRIIDCLTEKALLELLDARRTHLATLGGSDA